MPKVGAIAESSGMLPDVGCPVRGGAGLAFSAEALYLPTHYPNHGALSDIHCTTHGFEREYSSLHPCQKTLPPAQRSCVLCFEYGRSNQSGWPPASWTK